MRKKATKRGRQPRKNQPNNKSASSSSPSSSSSKASKVSKATRVTKATTKSPSKRTAKAPVTRSKTSTLPQTQADIDNPNSLYWAELLLDRTTPEPIDWRHPQPTRRGHDASKEDEHLSDSNVPTLQQTQESAFGPWSEEFESRLRDFIYAWMKNNVHDYPFTPPPEFLFSPEHIREISCSRFPCGKIYLQDYLTAHARNQFAQDIIVELIFWIQEEKRVMHHACFDYDDTRKIRTTTFAWKNFFPYDG